MELLSLLLPLEPLLLLPLFAPLELLPLAPLEPLLPDPILLEEPLPMPPELEEFVLMPAFCSSSRTIWRIRCSDIELLLELDPDPRLPDELLPVPPDDEEPEPRDPLLLLEPGVLELPLDDPDVPPLC